MWIINTLTSSGQFLGEVVVVAKFTHDPSLFGPCQMIYEGESVRVPVMAGLLFLFQGICAATNVVHKWWNPYSGSLKTSVLTLMSFTVKVVISEKKTMPMVKVSYRYFDQHGIGFTIIRLHSVEAFLVRVWRLRMRKINFNGAPAVTSGAEKIYLPPASATITRNQLTRFMQKVRFAWEKQSVLPGARNCLAGIRYCTRDKSDVANAVRNLHRGNFSGNRSVSAYPITSVPVDVERLIYTFLPPLSLPIKVVYGKGFSEIHLKLASGIRILATSENVLRPAWRQKVRLDSSFRVTLSGEEVSYNYDDDDNELD